MLIDTTLLAENDPIARGLADGTLKRFGGVIRETANGQIKKHLLEPPATSRVLQEVATPGPSLAQFQKMSGQLGQVHGQLGQVSGQLGRVLQVSQVAAAASVLNLGVSIVGFAYMGYKLNQLQKEVGALQRTVEAGFDRVEERLDVLQRQLGYAILLAEHSVQERERIHGAVVEVHRVLLVGPLSELQAYLDELDRYEDGDVRGALRKAGEVRRLMADQAQRVGPEPTAHGLLLGGVSLQGWAAAAATETHLLLRDGRFDHALGVIEEARRDFREVSEGWAGALLGEAPDPLRTAYRFSLPRFEADMLPERVERIARLNPPDADLAAEAVRRARAEAEVELDMSYNAALDEDWTRRQVAEADFLDGLSEMSDRLDGLHAFARECEARDVPSSADLLPGEDAQPGLYLLDATVE